MPYDMVLEHARVVTPGAVLEDAAVAISGEKIAAVGLSGELGPSRRTLNLEGKVLFPGMFDPHCHLGSGDERTWDYMAESFAQDTKDCLLGGVTAIATTTVLARTPLPDNLRSTIRVGDGRSYIDYRVTPVVLTEEHVEEIPAAVDLGARGFKFYCGYCLDQAEKMGMNRQGVPTDMFYRACEKVSQTGVRCLMMVHAEEPHVRRLLGQRYKSAGREDLVAWALHSPQWSESVQVFEYGVIAHDFAVPLYVVHISRAPTIDLIEYLRGRGFDILAETLVCFLATTAEERQAAGCGIRAKIQPPIRFHEDKERLWRALQAGTVTAVGTDTIPYTSKYKGKQPFWDARPGLNIQTIDSLPLLLTEGYHKGRVSLPTLAKVLAENPARYFGVGHRKGCIAPGYDADLVVIDTEKESRLGHYRMRGGSDYSIWEGLPVKGMPVMTLLRGQLVAQDGEIVAAQARGHYLLPGGPAGR